MQNSFFKRFQSYHYFDEKNRRSGESVGIFFNPFCVEHYDFYKEFLLVDNSLSTQKHLIDCRFSVLTANVKVIFLLIGFYSILLGKSFAKYIN